MGSHGRAASTLVSAESGGLLKQFRDVILLLCLSGVSLIFNVMVTTCLKSTWTNFREYVCLADCVDIIQRNVYTAMFSTFVDLTMGNETESAGSNFHYFNAAIYEDGTELSHRLEIEMGHLYLHFLYTIRSEKTKRDYTEISIIYEST